MIEGSLIKYKERDSRHKFNWHMLRTLKVKTPDPNLKLEETDRIREPYGCAGEGLELVLLRPLNCLGSHLSQDQWVSSSIL